MHICKLDKWYKYSDNYFQLLYKDCMCYKYYFNCSILDKNC